MPYRIIGGRPLKGNLFIQGAKNSALPIIAAALLPKKGQSVLRNISPLNDILVSIEIAKSAGAKVWYYESERTLVVDGSSVNRSALDSELTKKSRASILFLPPTLYRMKEVSFNGIGGCCLGLRKLDFHFNGFKRLGAKVEGNHDQLHIEADRLKGSLVYLDISSQTSTENLMMAGCLAEGETVIENAASEPEVVDFANFLNKMGAKISGAGTQTITIEGVKELNPVEHTVMSDRLDAGALMIMAAFTKSDITFIGAELEHMRILQSKLEQMGTLIETDGKIVRVRGMQERPRPINVVTWPYPGFSTDFLPAMMAFSTIAEGTSYVRENVFENRFTQVDGLNSFGAKITTEGDLAKVEGVERLKGSKVSAPDIRAGMAFILAGLAAEGETEIDNVYQIERGHSDIVQRLSKLGADINSV